MQVVGKFAQLLKRYKGRLGVFRRRRGRIQKNKEYNTVSARELK